MPLSTLSLLVDGLLVVIFILCLRAGWRQGFARTAVSVVGLTAALALSLWLSEIIAVFVYETVVYRALSAALEAAYASDDALRALERLMQENTLLSALSEGIDPAALVSQGFESTLQFLSEGVLRPVAEMLLRIVSFILLFVLLSALVRLLARAMGLVHDVPLLGTADRLGGLLFGALRGVLLAMLTMLLAALLRDLLPEAEFFSARVWNLAVLPSYLRQIPYAGAMLIRFGA